MKKRIALLLMVIWQLSFAQYIEFKDSVFKNYLLDKELIIDKNNNNEIEFSEAELVTSLDINNKGITDISELKYFINLKALNCNDNKIDTLVIEDLPKLKEIYCRTNKIVFLKLVRLNSLEELIAGMNFLTSIEINDCPNLRVLYLQENNLSNIDLTKFPLLEHLIIPNNELNQIDISKNKKLIQITVDYNKLTKLDVRENINLKYVYVDDNVERIVSEKQKKNSPFLIKPPAEAPPPPGN